MSEGFKYNYLLYIALFAVDFGMSLLTTPLARKISMKFGAIDQPKARGIHKKPIPRMGGIAIIWRFMGTTLILAPFYKRNKDDAVCRTCSRSRYYYRAGNG